MKNNSAQKFRLETLETVGLPGDLMAVEVINAAKVPDKGDLYIDKLGRLRRCTKTNFSRRAQTRIIVQERFKNGCHVVMGNPV